MQIRKGLWASLILLLFFFQNCSKNDHVNSGEASPQSGIISIDQAKAWAAANLNPKSNARQSGGQFIGSPSWSRKKEVLVTSGEGILKVALEKYAVSFGYRDLLFQRQPDGSTRSIIQQVQADSSYLAGKILHGPTTGHGVRYYISNDDFSGDVTYFDPLTNHFLYGWRYQNGTPKYILKQKINQSTARNGGGSLDDDDDGEDGGGSSSGDTGWSGTGNNTDGYIITTYTTTAPAPPKPNLPPYIPPTSDPGPINPPTIPVGGGGNQAGGNGGPKNDPKADDNYEDTDLKVDAIPCPVSFAFVRTGDWQSAVIKGYYFEYYDRQVSGKHITITVGTIEVGVPRLTYDGSLIQPEIAQAMSAQAAAIAEQQTLFAIQAWLIINPRATQQDIDNNPRFVQLFKDDFREAINQFLRADYGYKNNASPATVSTSQAQFVLKDQTLWRALKFYGRDC